MFGSRLDLVIESKEFVKGLEFYILGLYFYLYNFSYIRVIYLFNTALTKLSTLPKKYLLKMYLRVLSFKLVEIIGIQNGHNF